MREKDPVLVAECLRFSYAPASLRAGGVGKIIAPDFSLPPVRGSNVDISLRFVSSGSNSIRNSIIKNTDIYCVRGEIWKSKSEAIERRWRREGPARTAALFTESGHFSVGQEMNNYVGCVYIFNQFAGDTISMACWNVIAAGDRWKYLTEPFPGVILEMEKVFGGVGRVITDFRLFRENCDVRKSLLINVIVWRKTFVGMLNGIVATFEARKCNNGWDSYISLWWKEIFHPGWLLNTRGIVTCCVSSF